MVEREFAEMTFLLFNNKISRDSTPCIKNIPEVFEMQKKKLYQMNQQVSKSVKGNS